MSKQNEEFPEEAGEEQIEQFIRNKKGALEKVYHYNFKIVRSYIMKNSGSEADAKDVLQEAMMITWLNLKEGKFKVQNEFSLSAYIFKIAKHKWLDKLKKIKNRASLGLDGKQIKDVDQGVPEYIETEQRLKYLGRLYEGLDVKCKEVLNQFYYEQKPLEEIALALNYDVGSIRTIKYRCMQKLRKMHEEIQNETD